MIVLSRADDRIDTGSRTPHRYRQSLLVMGAGLLLALVLMVAAEPRSAGAYSDGWVNTDILNLRDGPGLGAAVIDKMYDGEYLGVLDGPTDDGWYYVEYQGTVGWAYGSYLWVNGAAGWGSGGSGQWAWVGTAALNLRSWGGSDASVIDLLHSNQEIFVTGNYSGGYVSVDVNGTTGWVWEDYLSYSGPTATSQAQVERWVDVNRSTQTVTLMEGNSAIASYWGAIGYDTSSYGFYSTAIGTYYVYAKNADINWTDWGQVYISHWVAYDPERFNGFHSYSLDAYGNVLPNGDGATGGCIALAPWAAEIVYDFSYIGMRVEIHW